MYLVVAVSVCLFIFYGMFRLWHVPMYIKLYKVVCWPTYPCLDSDDILLFHLYFLSKCVSRLVTQQSMFLLYPF
jgi:hypothetical protein